MVEQLRAGSHFKAGEPEEVVKAILKRELLGSTGIGRGVAIPHTKHPCVDRLIGSLAVSHKGVAFDSLDGDPVHVFVLLTSPQDRPADHLRALENVSRSLRDDHFVTNLKQSRTREAVWQLLTDPDRPG